MYLRGDQWSMTKRRRRRPSFWKTTLLLIAIGVMLYINQVVVPATPPLFVSTPTPTIPPESYVTQAEEFYREGKFPQAIDAYKKAINAYPDNAANYVALARLQVFTGDYESAVKNTQYALINNENNPTALAVQGWALGKQERYGEAELALKKAISLDPNNALAHAYLAEVLINQRDFNLWDTAAEESQTAINLDPSLMETHRARGLVLLNTHQDNIPIAIEELETALSINKNIADIHLNLGIAYQALGDPDKAEAYYLSAYTLNPKDTTALTQIVLSYFADGRYTQAAQFAEEAVKVEPSNPRLHGNLGIMYYKQEKYREAIPELALAVRGGTTEDGTPVEGLPLSYQTKIMEYYWYYGFALARSNRCGEAVQVFRNLQNGVPDDEIAAYNAAAGLELCLTGSISTPTPEDEAAPEADGS